MPSAQTYNPRLLPDTMYYPAYQIYQAPATAPTSPGASSATGSHLSSSADEHDYTHTFSSNPPDQSKPATFKSRKVAKSEGEEDASQKIARPPNAWILYRSKKLAEFKQSNPKMYPGKQTTRTKADRGIRPTQASFSKQIANMWAAEPAEVKEAYHEEASLRSVMHAIENPGYRFNPNKKRSAADRTKVKRERTKSNSPPYTKPLPRTIPAPINPSTSPGMLSNYFPSPVLGLSPASSQFQQSPWRQNDNQWALSPPAANPMGFSPSQGNSSPFDARYAQERRPSLKAQWDAIFPNEGQDGSLSASSCSTSFSSNYTGAESISPLWGTGLLPSLSIDEPVYSNPSPLVPSLLSGAFVDGNTTQSSTPAATSNVTSPVQFAFAPPSLALPKKPEYTFWPSDQQTQEFVGISNMGVDVAAPAASVPASSVHSQTPMEQQAASPEVIPVPQSTSQMSFDIAASTSPAEQTGVAALTVTPTVQIEQASPAEPVWWPYRHLKVKQDEVDGIPLEELIKSLGNPVSA
ncbi:hypothetical protein P389DRAFT_190636 [Cystobasidium minutum MCA 4210]|uniref:uncharacterized protein n=1 Tax=Cystobasidium minutum MCA 4210 TaxID=1397322 RepID=UPI0034CEFB10|eukprot:jgi/Rhomi1/190636/estExt_fgenesh1_pg.C_5_t10464